MAVRHARVEIQGVPVFGVIDSGADVTVIGGNLLRKVATIAKLRKKDLKHPDKTPRNYYQSPFTLHGKMDLDVSFAGTMTTPVYIKVDTEEQLLFVTSYFHLRMKSINPSFQH